MAMRYLDTCVIIDFLRGRSPELYDLFKRANPKLIAVPSVVVAELFCGAEKSANPRAAREAVEEFLLPFQVVPFDWRCTYQYGKIRAALERQGKAVGGNDMLIAATALANDAVLVTNNVREFRRVLGLSLESYTVVNTESEDE